jgi:hypothetical protein
MLLSRHRFRNGWDPHPESVRKVRDDNLLPSVLFKKVLDFCSIRELAVVELKCLMSRHLLLNLSEPCFDLAQVTLHIVFHKLIVLVFPSVLHFTDPGFQAEAKIFEGSMGGLGSCRHLVGRVPK